MGVLDTKNLNKHKIKHFVSNDCDHYAQVNEHEENNY